MRCSIPTWSPLNDVVAAARAERVVARASGEVVVTAAADDAVISGACACGRADGRAGGGGANKQDVLRI